MFLTRPRVIAAGLGAVVVAGGGVFAVGFVNRPAPDRAVALVPADAIFYATVFVDPSVDQKRAIQRLAERWPRIGSGRKVEQGAARLLEEPLDEAGLSFAADVAPWLGDQAAFFIELGPGQDLEQAGGAALLATTDIEASRDAVEKALAAEDSGFETTAESYKGVDYRLETGSAREEEGTEEEGTEEEGTEEEGTEEDAAYGFVDDFLVVGNQEGFEAVVDASRGASPRGLRGVQARHGEPQR